jgi:hypothetical protein
MLVIRNAQRHILAEPLIEEYQKRTYDFVAKEYPDELQRRGPDGMKRLIQRGVDKAQRYNVTNGPDVTALITLMIVFGDDFEVKDQRLLDLLTSPLDGRVKMSSLIDEMTARLKQQEEGRQKKLRAEALD